MDRFYLGKFVEETNANLHRLMGAALGDHLAFWLALDREVEVGENHVKMLRYLWALDAECPASRLLSLKGVLDRFCTRYSHTDVTLRFHFGHDFPPQPEGDGLLLLLRFQLLDLNQDHVFNRVRVLAACDDPEFQQPLLPRWLHLERGVDKAQVVDEVLGFCQQYLSSDFGKLAAVRDFEASFWRVVNLACCWLEVSDYDEIVAGMPQRFRDHVADLPGQWHGLRKQEQAFSEQAFVRCSRGSFRFCQQLMALDSA